jgi:hypothetical protein
MTRRPQFRSDPAARARLSRQIRRPAVGLLLIALTGCSSAAAAPTPAPPAAQPAPAAGALTDCSAGQGARSAAVLDAIGAGVEPEQALTQAYGRPVTGLTSPEQSEALDTLAGVDSCAAIDPAAKAQIPRLVRLIAMGAPAAPPAAWQPVADTAAGAGSAAIRPVP